MARKSKQDELKAKEAKQKKILVVLLVVLAVLGVIQGPKLMKATSSSTPSAPVPATTAPVGATPADPTTAVPASVGGATPTGDTPTAAAASLADSDVTPTPGGGQLVRFDLFASKDPFVQQVKEVAAATTPPAGGSIATTPTETTPAPGAGPFGGSTAPSEPLTPVARISIDRVVEDVVAERDFPAAAPVFHLVSFTAERARIAVVGGSYASGDTTLELVKGRSVTLEDTADGTRYVLVYLGAKKVPTAQIPPAPVTTAATATTPAPAPPPTTTTTAPSTP